MEADYSGRCCGGVGTWAWQNNPTPNVSIHLPALSPNDSSWGVQRSDTPVRLGAGEVTSDGDGQDHDGLDLEVVFESP